MAYGTLQVQAGFDLSDLTGGIDVDVVESGAGGANFSVTLTSGKRFLSDTAASASGHAAQLALVTPYTSLLTEIASAMTAASAQTYTVSYSTSTQRVTFSGDGAGSVTGFTVTPAANGAVLGLTGVIGASGNNGPHAAQSPPLYLIDCTIGYWSGWSGHRAMATVRVDQVAQSGRPHGIRAEGVDVHLDLTVPLEPWATVHEHRRVAEAVGTRYTWEALFGHVANVLPLSLHDGVEIHYLRLRDEGVDFEPAPQAEDYLAYWDIPIRARVLGYRAA